MNLIVKSLIPLALMLGLHARLEGADKPPPSAKDVIAAVKKYSGTKGTDLKAVDSLTDLVDVAKLKAGTGLEVMGTTDYKFIWTYAAKKKLADADLKNLEAAGRELLEKALTAGKNDLKWDDDSLKLAVAAAKAMTFKVDDASSVGPMTGVIGELPLANLTADDVKQSVKSHLKAKSDAFKSIQDLVHVEDLTLADGLEYSTENGVPVFVWKYAAKKEKVADDDKKKISSTIQDVLSIAMTAEKDKSKKLKPDDLKIAIAAAKQTKTEPKNYSRLYELTSDTFKNWVMKYVAEESAKTLLNELKGKVVLEIITEPTHLRYVVEQKKLVWDYLVPRGVTLSKQDQDYVAAKLKELLKNAIKDAKLPDAYPSSDLEKLNAIVDAGTLKMMKAAGLDPRDLTQAKVRETVRRLLRVSAKPELSRNALKNAGLAMLDDTDLDLLLDGLTFKTEKDLKDIVFKWTYRWADANTKPDESQTAKIDKLLKEILEEAIMTGGGNEELLVLSSDYESYFAGPVHDMTTHIQFGFAITNMNSVVVSDMVKQYVGKRRPTQIDALRNLILVNSIHDINVLTFDIEKVSFSLDIPTNPDLEAPLKPEEEKRAIDLVKQVLTLAFTKPVGGETLTLNKDDMKKVTDAIASAKIKILPLKESKEKARIIAFEQQVREKQEETDRRILELEERLAQLQGHGQTQPEIHAELPQTPATTQPAYHYEVRRSGLFGCRRTLVIVYP